MKTHLFSGWSNRKVFWVSVAATLLLIGLFVGLVVVDYRCRALVQGDTTPLLHIEADGAGMPCVNLYLFGSNVRVGFFWLQYFIQNIL